MLIEWLMLIECLTLIWMAAGLLEVYRLASEVPCECEQGRGKNATPLSL